MKTPLCPQEIQNKNLKTMHDKIKLFALMIHNIELSPECYQDYQSSTNELIEMENEFRKSEQNSIRSLSEKSFARYYTSLTSSPGNLRFDLMK
jgi:hypothetical protein